MKRPTKVLADQLQLLREVLRCTDFQGKTILDAGTGRTSARALLERHPSEIVLVAASGDTRKAEPAEEVLAEFPDATGKVVLANLGVRELFKPEYFDFVLADHLIGEIDCFTPSLHVVVLSNILHWLRPGGELLVADTEPLTGAEGAAVRFGDNLMFWTQMVNVLAGHWKEKPRDYPSELVSLWLNEMGFVDITVSFYQRSFFSRTEAGKRHQAALERLERVQNENIRRGVREELDRALAQIRETPDAEWPKLSRTHYVINARKQAS